MKSVTTTLNGEHFDEADAWWRRSVDTCRSRFCEAEAAADRLALLRSWTRLNHGWLPLEELGSGLSAAEEAGLGRFGLALSADSSALRLQEPLGEGLFSEIDIAMRLDTHRRTFGEPASADAMLLRHLDYPAYRTATQKSALRAVVTAPPGAGLLVSMPTGAGKSLLFQLPALLWRERQDGACLVVITPTIALALDHAKTLRGLPGLEACCALTGDLTGEARDDLLGSFRRGEIPVLLMSPELALGAAREALLDAALPPGEKAPHLKARLCALMIDEAHIVESWGRAFRPDFQRLPSLVRDLRATAPALQVGLLSATLTPAARRELRRAYGEEGPWLEIEAGVPRYDCDVVVRSFSNSMRRDQALHEVVDRAPRPAIIYTTEVEHAARVHGDLLSRGYRRVALFTGEVSDPATRRRIVEDWSADRLDLVVATSAFGLGIDKGDVRAVIHACLPESPARWYQEVGRASRDGHQGLAVSLFTSAASLGNVSDVEVATRQATRSWLGRDLGEAHWQAMLAQPLGSRLESGERHLILDLDARRVGMSVLTYGEYNRLWNMSLLNLMQRAKVLEVVSVGVQLDGEPGRVWEVVVRDPRILAPDEPQVWNDIFARRDEEAAVARREVADFAKIMTAPSGRCVQAGVYDLIQRREGGHTPACGRCPACRAQGQTPAPRLHIGGLEQAWPISPDFPSALPPGLLLVPPADPELGDGLPRLVARLAAVGIEQILAPASLCEAIGKALAKSPARLGLLLSHDEWLRPPGGAIARIPTALLLGAASERDAVLVSRFRALAQAALEITHVVVAGGDRRVTDRRLDQVLSGHPPYPEVMLEALAAPRRNP